jgi:hypothetical protein
MGRALKIQHAGNVDTGIPGQTQIGNIGVVGGANNLSATSGANTIACVANIEYATGSYAAGDAYIVTQKGKHKYLVANTANTERSQICILANVPDANVGNLIAGQMAIQAVTAGGANVALYSITNTTGLGFAPDYSNINSQGNLSNATTYEVSFVAANATPQSGSNKIILLVDKY